MTATAQTLLDHPLAGAFGVAGLLCQIIWPMLRARRAILVAQFGIGADYSAHYALLGAWSGAGTAGIGALQTAITLLAGDRARLSRLGLLPLPAVVGICCATWSGPASFFACAACSLVMVGRTQRDTLHLRMFLFAATPFGIGYDLCVGAVPALIGATVSASLSASALAREIAQRRQRAGAYASP